MTSRAKIIVVISIMIAVTYALAITAAFVPFEGIMIITTGLSATVVMLLLWVLGGI